MNHALVLALALMADLPPTGGAGGRDGPVLMANDQIKDCSYWDSRIAEAQRNAQTSARQAAGAPASMRRIYNEAARLHQAAIPKYQAEARACRQRAQQNARAPGRGPGPGGPGAGGAGGQPSLSDNLRQIAKQMRDSGREEAAKAIDQLRGHYEGGSYRGSSSGHAAVDTAKSLGRTSTDELSPDGSDTWGGGSTYSTPPAKNRGPGKKHGNDPIDGRDLPKVIDFLPDGAPEPDRFIDFSPVEAAATAGPPPPPGDYLEQGYMDEAILARETCEALQQRTPGPEAADEVLGVSLDEGTATEDQGYSSEGFNPDLENVETLAADSARDVVRDAVPEPIAEVLDVAEDPAAAEKRAIKLEAEERGVGRQIDMAFGFGEGAIECQKRGDGRCQETTFEATARELPVYSSLYEAKDELEGAITTVTRVMDGVGAVARGGRQILGKTADLGRALGNLAEAKLFKMAGGRCIYHREAQDLQCWF